MPVFEHRCQACNEKFEVLHKSSTKIDDVTCPKCQSKENKKLLSSFAASVSSGSSYDGGCSTGTCGTNYNSGGGCASGMCGLN